MALHVFIKILNEVFSSFAVKVPLKCWIGGWEEPIANV